MWIESWCLIGTSTARVTDDYSSTLVGFHVHSCGRFSRVAGKHVAWFMPEETKPHVRTWMAFCGDEALFFGGGHLVDEVHPNLALIANTIVKYEPVTMLVNEGDARTDKEARTKLQRLFPDRDL